MRREWRPKGQARILRNEMAIDSARIYELVTPEELKSLRHGNRRVRHPDLHRAIVELKNLNAGEGLKLKCIGTAKEAQKRQKAALQIARRKKIPVRTMLRGGWLFIEKAKERKP